MKCETCGKGFISYDRFSEHVPLCAGEMKEQLIPARGEALTAKETVGERVNDVVVEWERACSHYGELEMSNHAGGDLRQRIAQLLRAERAAALEEAAKVADRWRGYTAADAIADDIRSLKEPTP